jgi:hypothetical protein
MIGRKIVPGRLPDGASAQRAAAVHRDGRNEKTIIPELATVSPN